MRAFLSTIEVSSSTRLEVHGERVVSSWIREGRETENALVVEVAVAVEEEEEEEEEEMGWKEENVEPSMLLVVEEEEEAAAGLLFFRQPPWLLDGVSM
jgi:hypothetical protein